VLHILLENPMHNAERPLKEVMGAAFPTVQDTTPITQLNRYISKDMPAVLVHDRTGSLHIVTQYDLIQAI
jgi:cystathionine beta-synthase